MQGNLLVRHRSTRAKEMIGISRRHPQLRDP